MRNTVLTPGNRNDYTTQCWPNRSSEIEFDTVKRRRWRNIFLGNQFR